MKKLCYILVFFTVHLYCQVSVDDTSHTTEQLVDNVLINSACAETSNYRSATGLAVGINGIGYFESNGTSFPFKNGIVLSTGKASSVPGPNEEDHQGEGIGEAWFGDSDLEAITQTPNTQNASYIAFDFVPYANTIRFDFLFASEEYFLDFPCRFSDVFAFILTDSNGVSKNLAVIPGTNIPVKVTEIHEAVSGATGCPAKNEEYFDGYNNPINSPISLNGQTVPMTARADVIPGEKYTIKLVIADEQDGNYDSAVFIAGGSFDVTADLGEDRTIANGNAACPGTTVSLDAGVFGSTSYTWYKDGVVLPGEINATLDVTQAGTYRVEFNANNGCIGSDSILIEFAPPPALVSPTPISVCGPGSSSSETFDLTLRESEISNGVSGLTFRYYESQVNVDSNLPISNSRSYQNTSNPQTIIVEAITAAGCKSYTTLELRINQFPAINMTPQLYEVCDDSGNGTAGFNLASRISDILNGATGVDIYFYPDRSSAGDGFPSQRISNTENFVNSQPFSQTIYVRAEAFGNSCSVIFPLELSVLQWPVAALQPEYALCIDATGNPVLPLPVIDTGLDPSGYTFQWYQGEQVNPANEIAGAEGTSFSYSAEGAYTVKITSNTSGCELLLSTRVVASYAPVILNVEVASSPFSGNHTINATVTGNGTYYFTINDSQPQPSGTFTGVPAGKYVVSVFDEFNCGMLSQEITILDYMRFFTPNGDGINDSWDTSAFSSLSRLEIHIFDRFGKLMKVLNQNNTSWDGTFNGNMVPSGDYWFRASFVEDQTEKTVKGHFALKR
ncbi:choice-of-anchor L domain-containing protein [Ascidiimonas aurantiaca]|uniref:choice-of-anchor L domain-containing protein n=1 Tax=Ascidiimonas aurantiaca TaxID=1685432 RepID=UPI0030EC0E9E